MSPEVDQILGTSAGQLMALAPLLPEGYGQGQASLLAFMMIMSAQEFERAAEVRFRENTEIRALFRKFSSAVEKPGLRKRIEAAAKTRDESFAVSALNRTNAELRRLLILLQIHVEQEGDTAAQKAIWDVLKRSAARRLVRLA